MNITQNSMLTSDRLALLLPAPPLETDWPFPGRVHWVSVPGPCVWNEKRNGWRASQRFESSSQPAPHTGTLAPVYTTAAATQTENKQHRKLWDEMTDKKMYNMIKCASYTRKWRTCIKAEFWFMTFQNRFTEIQSRHMQLNSTRL